MRRLLALFSVLVLVTPLHASDSPFGGALLQLLERRQARPSSPRSNPPPRPCPPAAAPNCESSCASHRSTGSTPNAPGSKSCPVPAWKCWEIQSPPAETEHDPFLAGRRAGAQARCHLRGPPAGAVGIEGCARCCTATGALPSSASSRRATPWKWRLAIAGSAPSPAFVPSGGAPVAFGNLFPRRRSACGRLRAAGCLWLLLLAFGAGIATSFTPCVYPMIPITVGIIGARSAGRRSKGFTLSLLYVLGIAVTTGARDQRGADRLALRQHLAEPLGGGAVAAIFVLMAMSLFGAFELPGPRRVRRAHEPGARKRLPGRICPRIGGGGGGLSLHRSGARGDAGLRRGERQPAAGVRFSSSASHWGSGLLFIVLGTFTGVLASLPALGCVDGASAHRLRLALPGARGLLPASAPAARPGS